MIVKMRFKYNIQCYRRFQQGAELIQGGESLFQGMLLLVVKDTQQADAPGVAREFVKKLNTFINNDRSKESFVLQMVCECV